MAVEGNRVATIVSQYTEVVGRLDQMFDEARVRTTDEDWRSDGRGSCNVIVNKELSEIGLRGEARDALIELREERRISTGVPKPEKGCPYFQGRCILKERKAPVCIRHFDNPEEWQERFNIDAGILKHSINLTLWRILQGWAVDDPLIISTFLEALEQDIDTIKQAPILDHELKLS